MVVLIVSLFLLLLVLVLCLFFLFTLHLSLNLTFFCLFIVSNRLNVLLAEGDRKELIRDESIQQL